MTAKTNYITFSPYEKSAATGMGSAGVCSLKGNCDFLPSFQGSSQL